MCYNSWISEIRALARVRTAQTDVGLENSFLWSYFALLKIGFILGIFTRNFYLSIWNTLIKSLPKREKSLIIKLDSPFLDPSEVGWCWFLFDIWLFKSIFGSFCSNLVDYFEFLRFFGHSSWIVLIFFDVCSISAHF